MKRTSFYVCPTCGNIIVAVTHSTISCCGKKMMPLEVKKADRDHFLSVERIENDYFISSGHEMEKGHYISFVAFVSGDMVMIRKLYPEWNVQIRIPVFAHGKLVWYCTQHGAFYMNV